jgi:hypothetical protein
MICFDGGLLLEKSYSLVLNHVLPKTYIGEKAGERALLERGLLLDKGLLLERGLLLDRGLVLDRELLLERGLLLGRGLLLDRGLLLKRGLLLDVIRVFLILFSFSWLEHYIH